MLAEIHDSEIQSSLNRAHVCHRYLGSVSFAFKNALTSALNHKTCIKTSGQILEKTLFAINAIFSKVALKANRVLFKTLTRSIYTSFMLKGGDQGVLKRKNY